MTRLQSSNVYLEGGRLIRQQAEYAEALYASDNFGAAFQVLEKEAQRIGFEAILYTYIPGMLVNADVPAKPLYQVSDNYAPDYLSHYEEARFDRYDPLIKAVSYGVKTPIDWAGETCNSYMKEDVKSREVIDVAHSYNIKNGITLPLEAGQQGIAGASLINGDKGSFDTLLQERLPELRAAVTMYHNLVLANSGYFSNFIKPVFASLNKLEIRYLAGLASGKSQVELAAELCRSEKYLEQVMLRMRRKISGVDSSDKPTINRNQLLYYAGLVNIVRQSEMY